VHITGSVGVLVIRTPKPTRFVASCDPKFYRGRPLSGVWENVEFCISAAIIYASNGLHAALSQHLLSFLFSVPKISVKFLLCRQAFSNWRLQSSDAVTPYAAENLCPSAAIMHVDHGALAERDAQTPSCLLRCGKSTTNRIDGV